MHCVANNVEHYLARKYHWKLTKKAEIQLRISYRLELDVSPVLDSRHSAYYMSLIGVLMWILELSWVDICLDVS